MLIASVPGLLASFSASAGQPDRDPVRVIFDTDIWSDIDDVMALAMLHTLQDRGEVNLLAVTSSTEEESCASFIDLLNTWYGHGSIPVGVVRGGVTAQAFRDWLRAGNPQAAQFENTPNYTQYFPALRGPDGNFVYPHHLADGSRAADAVPLLRRVLAQQPDKSTVMIQVGFSTNLAQLLESKADAASPLDGRALIEKKVRLLSIMAGNFGDSQFLGKLLPAGSPEFNVILDASAAKKLYAQWPTPIVDSGFEIGISMRFPGERIVSDFRYARHHPVANTYVYVDEHYRRTLRQDPDKLHDHPVWDLTSVLYAVRPDHGYFGLSKPGRISALDDGGTRFEETANGRHYYLTLSSEQRPKVLEALIELTSEPPVTIGRQAAR